MNNFEGIRESLRVNTHPTPQKHLGWLGPVRMLIITIISFGYASTMPRGPSEKEYFNLLGYDPSWLGISVIFMVTGYLSMRSLERHGSARKLLTSRIGRNFPMLVLFAALVILIVFPLFGLPVEEGSTRTSQNLHYFLKVVTCVNPSQLTPGLLDNAVYMCVIHGGLWTFRWGLVAFIATAILWAVGALKNTRILAAMAILLLTLHIGLIYYAVNVDALSDLSAHPYIEFFNTGLRLGWAYVAGMCGFVFRHKIPKTLLLPVAIIGFAIISYVFLPWTPFIEIALDIGLGLLTLCAIQSTWQVPTFIKSIPDLSLGLYIFNWPTAQLTLLMLPAISPLSLFAISFPLTVLLAYISWASLSRPLNKKISARLDRRETQTA